MASARRCPVGRSLGEAGRYDDLVREARRSLMQRDFDAALAQLELAVDEDDRRPEAFNLLGVVEEVRGERSEARTYWRLALVLRPGYEPAEENLLRVTVRPRPPGGLSLG